jgi:PAS domain S-box-containing protein
MLVAEGDWLTERERLRITLASIGDAVISTDAESNIVFLNPVAERLTGWGQEEAAGRPLPEIFRITKLPTHTLLAARDGTERPIEESAATMRNAEGVRIGSVLVFRDISERHRAEVEQAQLAAIIQSSDDAIISKTLEGIIQSWNAGAERLFGYTSEEAIGRHITLIIPPERRAEETSIIERIRRGERVEHFETVRVGKHGPALNMSLTISPIKDREGRIIGASKIGRDISERIRTEASLRESEAQKRFLLELASATQPLTEASAIMSTTARMLAEHLGVDRCAYAEVENKSIFAITGDYSRNVPSIVGRWPIAAFGPECLRCMLENEPYVVDDVDSDPRIGVDVDAYRATNIQAVICLPLHKAGDLAASMAVHQTRPRKWTSAEIELVRTVVGRSWEALERARVAHGLEEAAERLELAIVAARLGDWSWNTKTDLVTFSMRAAEIFGIPPGPVLTWGEMRAMIYEEDREQTRLAVERAIVERSNYDVEYRIRRTSGERVWISAKGRAQYDFTGVPLGMFGVVQDITDKKVREEELRQRAAELAEADRQKDEFIALLAHELRNPLAPLRTGLQIMRLGDAEASANARAMMDRQLSHLVRLIDDLLDISRMNRNRPHLQKSTVYLSEIIGQAVESAEPAILAAGHTLHVSLPQEAVELHADLMRLSQVFGNLLSNSAKYTNAGGEIRLSAEALADEVLVTVRDNGIGIPPEALPHVFEMFTQVDPSIERSKGGLGIGLALVKGLVEAHGGSVTAQSEGRGRGSTFTVRLPRTRSEKSTSPVVAETKTSPSGTNRVLVVDDNLDAAASLGELLEILDQEVDVVHDGTSAVAAIERFRPQLVLMDLGMPGMDGLEATHKIRELPGGRDVKIYALTGWGQNADRERSRAAGCDGHLVKPVSFEDLEKLLGEL